jgi:hypothetical protein
MGWSCGMHGIGESKRLFERSSYRLEANTKTELKDIGREDVDWIYLAHATAQWRNL